jgi:hypothetical protein
VARHAAQFDEELARRPPGSQEEEAAAGYLLGHLQRAGYRVLLQGVPVANAVSSVDLVALPPAGGRPSAVVAVAYDSGPEGGGYGEALGTFLELGRALGAARPRHSIELVGLGAEHADESGGHLGSRRLARLLLDSGDHPVVITLEGRSPGSGFGAVGAAGPRLIGVAERLGVPIADHLALGGRYGRALAERARIFAAAGLEHAGVTGNPSAVGRVLLRFLLGEGG